MSYKEIMITVKELLGQVWYDNEFDCDNNGVFSVYVNCIDFIDFKKKISKATSWLYYFLEMPRYNVYEYENFTVLCFNFFVDEGLSIEFKGIIKKQ